MVAKLTGWLDYDRPCLPTLGPVDRIAYFERRVRMVAVNPLERILENEVHVSPHSSALLIFGVSICCAMEANGKFLRGETGTGNNANRFHGFLAGYMTQEFQSKHLAGATYGECLWSHFRNGLAHGFAVSHGGFERNRGQAYFQTKVGGTQDTLSINPYLLYDDYVAGFERYVADVRKACPGDRLFRRFDRTFDDVFVAGN